MMVLFPQPGTWSRVRASWILLLVVLSTGGCARGKPTGTVAGQVLRQGKPVTAWEITIDRREAGITAANELDDQGKFAFAVPFEVGTYALFLAPLMPTHPQDDPAMMKRLAKKTSVPKKYLDSKTSGWSLDVHEGKNDVVLEITD